MAEQNQPAFTTERLVVYEFWAVPCPALEMCERCIFLAFLNNDNAYPICTLTLWGEMIEMINTHPFYLREGFAKELILGVNKYWNTTIHGDAVSDEGEALLASLDREPAYASTQKDEA